MRTVFVTHKHMDHLLGILWLMRMMCQSWRRGTYDGEAVIYGHEEVISLLRTMGKNLLSSKDSAFLDDRLHLVTVADGETRQLIGHDVTFFDPLDEGQTVRLFPGTCRWQTDLLWR